ncbi:DUF1353 domain-containing protein [Streptomyces sp. NPDC047043]|uniref:DUF1353 domain-containing protein n=1 Tax=Streptomyces sp. NPDC047043 TaxID=3154497 RepID=UPI00340C03EF
MPFRKGDITVKQIGPKTWELLAPVEYEGRDRDFIVPPGFTTDFASVPTVFVWLIPRYGVYTKAAVLHDFLCCNSALVSRRDADGIFRRALRELGVSVLRRWMMWAAVRAGGHWSGAGVGQWVLWLLVATPAVAFLAVPTLVVTFWLLLFLAAEWLVYAVTPPGVAPPANRPHFTGAPGTAGEASAGGLPVSPPDEPGPSPQVQPETP